MPFARPLALRVGIAALALAPSAPLVLLACASNPAPPVCNSCDEAGIDATFSIDAAAIDAGSPSDASLPDAGAASHPLQGMDQTTKSM